MELNFILLFLDISGTEIFVLIKKCNVTDGYFNAFTWNFSSNSVPFDALVSTSRPQSTWKQHQTGLGKSSHQRSVDRALFGSAYHSLTYITVAHCRGTCGP